MCEFYCIASVECMTLGKCLLNCTNLFSPKDYKKNDKVIYKYFTDKHGKRKCKPWLSTKKSRWNKKENTMS